MWDKQTLACHRRLGRDQENVSFLQVLGGNRKGHFEQMFIREEQEFEVVEFYPPGKKTASGGQ